MIFPARTELSTRSLFRRFTVGSLATTILTTLLLVAGNTGTAGAAVIATPGPTARHASIWSEISFRGVKPRQVKGVTVTGSRSGRHGYTRKNHADRRGVSLVLKRPLAANESVRVRTGLSVYGVGRGGWTFRTESLGLGRGNIKAPVPLAPTGHPGYETHPNLKPPTLNITTNLPQATRQKLFIGAKSEGAAIYRADGEPIWFRRGRLVDLRRQMWGKTPVLTWIEAPSAANKLKKNTYMIANQRYRIMRKLTPGNGYGADIHEFRLTRRGTAYITAYHPERANLTRWGQGADGRVLDSIAQEVELRTGRVLWEWHSLDHVPVAETYAAGPKTPGASFDYFHINSVADTPDGHVIISGRSTNTAYKISRRTGRVIWRLGGRRSNFRMGKGTRFSWQHDTLAFKNGRITVYDNGDAPVAPKPWRKQSRGVIIKLNWKQRRARLVRSLFNPAKPLAATQGNLQSLGNGNHLVGFGQVPLISEYGPNGNLVFNARVQGVGSFYRAYRSPWQGRPRTRPKLVARLTGNPDQTRFWVSNNGDSETVTWKVFAGDSRNQLEHVVDRERDGFETVKNAPTDARFIQVRGFDRKGKSTGWSPIVRTER